MLGMNNTPDINSIIQCFKTVQQNICSELQKQDPKGHFQNDEWERPEGGGGISCIFKDGTVFEKGGVNFSHVHGKNLPPSASAIRPELAGRSFQATGVSIVIHPLNPFAPTSHFNIRFFIAEKPNHEPVWWFGGGFDLTPYYGFEEDAVHFHKAAKDACDPFGTELYPDFKKQADKYFFLKHRSEPRGIGGIFFDDLNFDGNFDKAFKFAQSISTHFTEAYCPIIAKRKKIPFTNDEKDFQLYRRGRYVEYNLVYDRGTLFGLQSGGRTESILMSLPPVVKWEYDWSPEKGTREADLYDKFLVAKDWLGVLS